MKFTKAFFIILSMVSSQKVSATVMTYLCAALPTNIANSPNKAKLVLTFLSQTKAKGLLTLSYENQDFQDKSETQENPPVKNFPKVKIESFTPEGANKVQLYTRMYGNSEYPNASLDQDGLLFLSSGKNNQVDSRYELRYRCKLQDN